MSHINNLLERNRYKFPVLLYNVREYRHWLKNFFAGPYKLNSPSTSFTPFFIIGSGRSGNTLLRSILTSHSKVAIPPESYVFQSVYRKFKLYRFMEWEDLARIIVSVFQSHKEFFNWQLDLTPVYPRIFNLEKKERTLAGIINEIYSYYCEEKFPGASIWGDKTPLNTLYLPWINKVFPRARYIHIIRDGRDVSASYLKAGLINRLDDACHRWNESINRARKFAASRPGDQYMELRYETLVTKPEEEIRNVCVFLGIQFEQAMLVRSPLNKLGDVDNLAHHENVRKPINKNSIGKWRRQFTEDQKVEVSRLLEKNLRLLRYEINEKIN